MPGHIDRYPALAVKVLFQIHHLFHQSIELRFLLCCAERGGKQTGLRFKTAAHDQKVIDDLIKVIFGHPPGEQLLIEKVPVSLRHNAGANARAWKHHPFRR